LQTTKLLLNPFWVTAMIPANDALSTTRRQVDGGLMVCSSTFGQQIGAVILRPILVQLQMAVPERAGWCRETA
jgi:hypothetical protein